MEKDALEKQLSRPVTRSVVLELAHRIVHEGFQMQDLTEVSFHRDKRIAFRAAWILETVAEKYPEAFSPNVEYFMSRYPQQSNQSCRRHFTKILMGLAEGKHDLTNIEPALEATFEWLIDPLSAVAVQANCMNILLSFSGRQDWIEGELGEQVAFLMKTGGAAIQSRGKKILSRLRKTAC